ncbi:MAG TPA: cytochrome c [Acetobacteraceae bacterium]|jgi:cytochrome c5
MLRKFLPLLLTAGIAMAPALAQAKSMIVLKPLSVDLPDNPAEFPPGPNVDVVNNNCRSCHSIGMVMNQPTMAKAAWQAEVAKMRGIYKAPVEQSDDAAIVDYLTAVKGPK